MASLTLMVMLITIIIYYLPGGFDLFVLDRMLVQQGEWWRLVSGHFTHYSFEHFFLNLLLFVPVSFVIERQKKFEYYLLIPILIIALDSYQWIFMKEMIRYAGLSGILTGIAGYLFLVEINKTVAVKIQWYILLFLLVLKILYEFYSHESVFIEGQQQVFSVVPEVHAMSLVTAIIYFMFLNRSSKKEN